MSQMKRLVDGSLTCGPNTTSFGLHLFWRQLSSVLLLVHWVGWLHVCWCNEGNTGRTIEHAETGFETRMTVHNVSSLCKSELTVDAERDYMPVIRALLKSHEGMERHLGSRRGVRF